LKIAAGLSENREALSDIATTALYRRITLRILPLLFLCYLCAYLDRINVSFAQLQMKPHLGFSDTVYGFGAGVFFLSYVLFEIPSNLWLRRSGKPT
jgi:sugar phosphate permease